MEATSVPKTIVDQIPRLLVLYDDGSVERKSYVGDVVPAIVDFSHGVAWKDVVINSLTGLWVRIFLPHSVASSSNHPQAPLVLYFHGGGMCLGSPAETGFHHFCCRMAFKSRSIWVSVGYRLAPEHRIPAQYEDCYEAFLWLHAQFHRTAGEGEPWILEHGECWNLFCAGESAGATILHYVAVRLSKTDWSPLRVRGLMFIDIRNVRDPLPTMKPSIHKFPSTPELLRAYLRLSLPLGASLGDPVSYCLHPSSPSLSETPFPPALVTVADRDLLYDGGLEYFHALKEAGNPAELLVAEGEGHCFHMIRPESEAAQLRESKLIEFMERLVQNEEEANG